MDVGGHGTVYGDVEQERQRVLKALLKREYPQQRLLEADDFVRLAGERGVWVREEHLEAWDRLGILNPILRVRHLHDYRPVVERKPGGEVVLGEGVLGREPREGEDVEKVYGRFPYHQSLLRQFREGSGRLEVPTAANHLPWATFRDGNGKKAVSVVYHPYQALRLADVAGAAQLSFRAPDFSLTDAEAEREMRWQREGLVRRRERLRADEAAWLRLLALLLRIEDRYLPAVREVVTYHANSDRDGRDWREWAEVFRAKAVLAEAGMTAEQVQEERRALALDAEQLDPYPHLYPLMRHVTYEHRNRASGDARLAWDYYEAAEVLGAFLEDATGEPQVHVDDLRMMDGRWKEQAFGVPSEQMDYRTGNALPSVVRHYGVDARTRVWLFAEGETEIEFIETWFRRVGLDRMVDAPSPLVRVVQTGGYPAFRKRHSAIRRQAEYVRDQDASLIVMLDLDKEPAQRRAVLEEWVKEGLICRIVAVEELHDPHKMPIGGLMWQPCFEDANFAFDELVRAWETTLRDEFEDEQIDEEGLRMAIEAARAELLKKQAVGTTAVGALESKIQTFGNRILKRGHGSASFSKPRVGKALADLFYQSDRPMIRLLMKVVWIASQRTARHHTADPPRSI